ncbi:hypothetical protein UY3_17250 [Chelonia mydas]|uniref:Uncharacterized protein n=1 Tax=Chelonia mydas TaxID=8469 RepID=M7AKI3_CHEMY|nr:hypothetical protein UY3_17250 [Chelonia mydas]
MAEERSCRQIAAAAEALLPLSDCRPKDLLGTLVPGAGPVERKPVEGDMYSNEEFCICMPSGPDPKSIKVNEKTPKQTFLLNPGFVLEMAQLDYHTHCKESDHFR